MNQRKIHVLLKAEKQAGEEIGRQSDVCFVYRMQSNEAASFSPVDLGIRS